MISTTGEEKKMTENKTSWIVKLVRVILKNWWKAIIIILLAGIFTIGFTCEWGNFKFKKDPLIEYKRNVEVKK
jgi:hypothetical protein